MPQQLELPETTQSLLTIIRNQQGRLLGLGLAREKRKLHVHCSVTLCQALC